METAPVLTSENGTQSTMVLAKMCVREPTVSKVSTGAVSLIMTAKLSTFLGNTQHTIFLKVNSNPLIILHVTVEMRNS